MSNTKPTVIFLSALLLGTACKPPPSAQAVHEWLEAYAAMDVERMAALTVAGDRDLVRSALAELQTVPTGTLAMSLPPRPLKHELLEIESKDEAQGRQVVLVKLTLKNPLPYMSKRVGNPLDDIPETRELRRRFLVVREGERWGVKLDLQRVLARVRFTALVQRKIEAQDYAGAQALLGEVPPPPDEANALKKSDRLKEDLLAEIEKAKKKGTSTSARGW